MSNRKPLAAWFGALLALAACQTSPLPESAVDQSAGRNHPRAGQPAPATTAARLRIEAHEQGYLAWADNPLPGPIEVMVRYRQRHNTIAQPGLPARATVAAGGSAVVAVFQVDDPSRAVDFDLAMDSVPGQPGVQPRDVLYLLPLSNGEAPRIDQGFGGRFSHDDPENHYAIDFALPIGTPVLAARDGLVMQVENGFAHPSRDRDRSADRANFIRLLHDDGVMTLYAHLQPDGVLVQPGQRITAGQHIGLSGNTGFTTGPHLHFAVQANRGMRLVSLPFWMDGLP